MKPKCTIRSNLEPDIFDWRNPNAGACVQIHQMPLYNIVTNYGYPIALVTTPLAPMGGWWALAVAELGFEQASGQKLGAKKI
jgi:hypothetical protein